MNTYYMKRRVVVDLKAIIQKISLKESSEQKYICVYIRVDLDKNTRQNITERCSKVFFLHAAKWITLHFFVFCFIFIWFINKTDHRWSFILFAIRLNFVYLQKFFAFICALQFDFFLFCFILSTRIQSQTIWIYNDFILYIWNRRKPIDSLWIDVCKMNLMAWNNRNEKTKYAQTQINSINNAVNFLLCVISLRVHCTILLSHNLVEKQK